ncbi:hypothetical protein ACB094_05G009300 [Castanea mollissima]
MGDFPTTRDKSLITRSKRHFTPDNFLLKIESFSLLSKSWLEYKSDFFEAGGYKWRLSLYPKGIKKNVMNGHISLYLAITETKELPLGWEVNASFKLFVFDQIRDEYLTVQDAGGGAIRRFNDINSTWGFAKFLPLDTFNDASQGYLVNNCCVFGAEVFVHERSVKRQCLSFIKEPDNSTLTWKIERFSTLNEEHYFSQEFTVGDSKCCYLQLIFLLNPGCLSSFPKEILSKKKRYQSEPSVFTKYKLRIRDQIKGKHKETITEYWFPSSNGWRHSEFLLLKDLYNASKGFLVNDTVIVEAEIIKMSKLK